jgi:hypothetical protein
MTESDLDAAINGLVAMRLTAERPEAFDAPIKALKEFRQKKTHWKNLVKGVRVIQRVQKRNMKDTDALIEALLQ